VRWQTPETFDDGSALFEAVCAHELEGVVAKRRSSRYQPAHRGWVKIKNRAYSRYEMELKARSTGRASNRSSKTYSRGTRLLASQVNLKGRRQSRELVDAPAGADASVIVLTGADARGADSWRRRPPLLREMPWRPTEAMASRG
jgi:hypothetical protein